MLFFHCECSSYKNRTSVQSHTNKRFFQLVESLLQIHSDFFSRYIKLRGFATIISNCLAALPAKMPAFNSHMRQNTYYQGSHMLDRKYGKCLPNLWQICGKKI